MYKKDIINIVMTIAFVLPIILLNFASAHAQKFMSRQNIVNGLQIQNQNVVRQKRHKVRRHHQPAQVQQRVVKRRAPAKQMMRVPKPNNRVVLRRAPSPNNNGQVAVRRAPPRNQQLRAPRPQNAGNQQFSRPPRVAERRAPAAKRAPTQNRAPQQMRAPQREPNVITQRRAPNRAPQRFNTQVAGTNEAVNQRGIRVEDNNSVSYNSASVDLEILFDYDSARISPESVRQLITLGEALQDAALRENRIMIVGHTDAAGSNAYNSDLSYRRAQSVSSFLNQYAGIGNGRLLIDGYGEEQLKYPDAPNSGQNRRVEIINLGS